MTRAPVSDAVRCSATAKSTGVRCAKAAHPGATVCKRHGAAAPQVMRKAALVRLEGMLRYVTPIERDDWEAHPINAFEMEFRRTVAHIRYFEERIAALSDDEFIWGRTKLEDIGATEFGGTNVTEESGTHIWEQALFRERRHLADLIKTWVAAGLGAKKLQMFNDSLDRLEVALTNIIVALGKDPRDPDVRKLIRDELGKVAA